MTILVIVDSNQRGCFAEYLFGIECLKRNIIVSFPVLDSCVYDCLADTGKSIYRIQVKYSGKSYLKNRRTIQCNWHLAYKKTDVDFFAVYVEMYKGFFIFPNNGIRKCIRVSLDNVNSKYFNNFDFNFE